MKKLLLLTTLFLAFACSKDDGENNEENQTFLEKYDGFGYENDGDYFYFSDSTIFLRYVDVDVDGETYGTYCEEIREGQQTVDGIFYEISILNNDSSSLLIEVLIDIDEPELYRETQEFTVDSTGNTLTLMYDGDPNDSETYTKTSTTFEFLCN